MGMIKRMKRGLIIDLETSGLDPKTDKIIEIALLEFEIKENFSSHIVSSFSQLQDPQIALSEDLIKLTGITDSILSGKNIQWDIVGDTFAKVDFIVAHNMEFDRSFLKYQSEINVDAYHWVCSQNHIDWFKKGHKTRALNYLACDQGFINPFPHRALFDCATTYRLISNHMEEMINKSYEKQFEFLATYAPFEQKDHLKNNGYRWDPTRRVWYKLVFQSDVNEEREFLNDKIYQGKSLHQENNISADCAS